MVKNLIVANNHSTPKEGIAVIRTMTRPSTARCTLPMYIGFLRLKAVDVISNCYKLRRELFNEMISSLIEVFPQRKEHLNPKFSRVVNA